VNEYLPGQGILPHEDGDAYYPVVATVSLGAAIVLDVYAKGHEAAKEPIWRVLQERRSLLITAGKMYTDHLHGIQGIDVDEEVGESGVVNWDLVGNKEAFRERRNVRATRVSLTFRDVGKVKRLGKAFRLVG
jgi:alkylated DNA repair protein alkB family protein 6